MNESSLKTCCFVWYRIKPGREADARRALNATLNERTSSRAPRVFVRRDDRGETWMELYEADAPMPTQPSHALIDCIDGEQHIERFEEALT